jgi:hypothetical protein
MARLRSIVKMAVPREWFEGIRMEGAAGSGDEKAVSAVERPVGRRE